VYTPNVLVLTPLKALARSAKQDGNPPRPSNAVGPEMLHGTLDAENWEMYHIVPDFSYLTSKKDWITIHVLKADGTNWKVICAFEDIYLTEGKSYVLTLRARSDSPHEIEIGARRMGPVYHVPPLTQIVELSPKWQTFTYTFTATNIGGYGLDVPYIYAAKSTGTVDISQVGLWRASR
jgi:hypothetical protein